MATTYTILIDVEDLYDERENMSMLESDVVDALDSLGLQVLTIKAHVRE